MRVRYSVARYHPTRWWCSLRAGPKLLASRIGVMSSLAAGLLVAWNTWKVRRSSAWFVILSILTTGSISVFSLGDTLLGSKTWRASNSSLSIAFFRAASMVLLLVFSYPTTTIALSACFSISRSRTLSPNAHTYMRSVYWRRAINAALTAAVTTKPSAMRPPPTTLTASDRPYFCNIFSHKLRSPEVTTTAVTCSLLAARWRISTNPG